MPVVSFSIAFRRNDVGVTGLQLLISTYVLRPGLEIKITLTFFKPVILLRARQALKICSRGLVIRDFSLFCKKTGEISSMRADVNRISEFIARFNFSEVTTLDPNRHVSWEAVWFGIYCNFALHSSKFEKCLLKKSLTVGIFCGLDACGKLSIFPQKSFHLSNFLYRIADLYSFVL